MEHRRECGCDEALENWRDHEKKITSGLSSGEGLKGVDPFKGASKRMKK